MAKIPIVTLTATAVPGVQMDIIQSLCLRDPLKSNQSLDRSNLKIAVVRNSASMIAAIEGLVQVLNSNDFQLTEESTIVYAPTRAQVEEVTLYLKSALKKAHVEAWET